MRISFLSILAPFASASDYCTDEQFTTFQAAVTQAATSVDPMNYDSVDAYVAASIAAVEGALGGADAAAGYPCFACFSTYQTDSFACITRETPDCTAENLLELTSQFSVCAIGTDLTKDASSLAPAAVSGLVATACLFRL
jgi:hypothetical protein